jgi:hypothetical protein
MEVYRKEDLKGQSPRRGARATHARHLLGDRTTLASLLAGLFVSESSVVAPCTFLYVATRLLLLHADCCGLSHSATRATRRRDLQLHVELQHTDVMHLHPCR